jgi:superfamily II DNA or RNA helicase
MKVIKKTVIPKTAMTYNLHVKKNHNYVANGVVVSNCHGIKGSALQDLLTGPMAKVPIRWGVTGTIPKEVVEQKALQVSVGNVVGSVKASDLQDQGVLANCHVHIKQLVDYGYYKQYQDELRYLLSTEVRLEYIASMLMDIGKSGNTLVLIDRVEPGKIIAGLIPDAVFLSGSTKSKDRKDHYDDFVPGGNKTAIATYGIAAVGINIVDIDNLVLIEPGKSFVRVIQSIGRGLRKGKEKDSVEIYDISSTCKFSKRHLGVRKKYYTEAGYPYSIKKIEWQ